MFTTIDHFFYNDLAGIQGPAYFSPDAVTPGFKQIIIQPFVPQGLNYAKAWHKTVRGTIFSQWHYQEDEFTLKVSIPVNSTAKICVPKIGFKHVTITENNILIWEKGKLLEGVEGIFAAAETDDYVTFETGSGSYRFQWRKTR